MKKHIPMLVALVGILTGAWLLGGIKVFAFYLIILSCFVATFYPLYKDNQPHPTSEISD